MNARNIAIFAGASLVAGALALADDARPPAPGAAGPKAPHRKWQDVPQPALDKVADPKPVVATLKNGVKLFLLEDHELPTIDVTLICHAGETDLPSLFPDASEHPTARARQKAGLASIAGQVMRSGGTAAKTGDELDEELDAMAASVETGASHDQAHVRMSCLKESFEATLAIFADVLKHPAFREERVALAKRQHMGALRRRNDNPAGIAGREFARLMYGDLSPFGWTEEAPTVEGIGRDDIVAFYRAAFAHPETALLGAVGDFEAAKLKDRLEAELGDWTGEKDASPAKVAIQTAGFEGPGPRVYFARKTDVNQSTVILGHTAIQRTPGDPDYPAAVLANSILGGGGFAGRLMQHVRTEMGLAYGCSSRLDAALGHQGTFVLQGQTKCGSTIAMAKAMRKELERMVSEPPSAEDMRVHKKGILERLVFSFDGKSQILDRALRNEFYGLPQNELEVFQQGLSAATADDVLRVAKKLFHPARLTTVVVGNDAEFDGKLEELGEVTPIELKNGPGGRGGRGRPAPDGTGTER